MTGKTDDVLITSSSLKLWAYSLEVVAKRQVELKLFDKPENQQERARQLLDDIVKSIMKK
jgi:hypothetical protein